MSWFHTHTWELVGKTYAEPRSFKMGESTEYLVAKLLMTAQGMTTYLWHCSDKNCSAIHKEECAGQEIK